MKRVSQKSIKRSLEVTEIQLRRILIDNLAKIASTGTPKKKGAITVAIIRANLRITVSNVAVKNVITYIFCVYVSINYTPNIGHLILLIDDTDH